MYEPNRNIETLSSVKSAFCVRHDKAKKEITIKYQDSFFDSTKIIWDMGSEATIHEANIRSILDFIKEQLEQHSCT